MSYNSTTSALLGSSSPSWLTLPTYRITRAPDLTLIYDPPIGSQELSDALSCHYPFHNGLQQKLQQASLDFLLSEKSQVPVSAPHLDISSLDPSIELVQSSPSPLTPHIAYPPPVPTTHNSQTSNSAVSGKGRPLRPRFNHNTSFEITVWDTKTGESTAAKPRGRTKGLAAGERDRVAKNRGNACEVHRRRRTTCLQVICPDNRLNACSYHRKSKLKCKRSCPNNLLNSEEFAADKEGQQQRELLHQPGQSLIYSADLDSLLQAPFQPSQQSQQCSEIRELCLTSPLQQTQVSRSSLDLTLQAVDFEIVPNPPPSNPLPLLFEISQVTDCDPYQGLFSPPYSDESFAFVDLGNDGSFNSHLSSWDDMSTCGAFEPIVPKAPAFKERQYRDSEANARFTSLERHTGSTRTSVEIGQADLGEHQLGGPQSELETPQRGVEEYQVIFGHLAPSRGEGASTKEIILDKLGGVSPTDGSSHGYDTASALGEETPTSQASSHHWSAEQYDQCIYAMAAIFQLWTQQLAFYKMGWNYTVTHCLSNTESIMNQTRQPAETIEI